LHPLWVFVTDCGDAAVTLPLAVLVLAVLLAVRARRQALAWLAAVAGCGMAIGALKLLFGACGTRVGALAVVSPSGHTAMSAAIYLSLALLVARSLPGAARIAVLAAAVLLVAAIAVSRMVLDFHDAAEVAMGLAVGLAATAGWGLAIRRQPAPALPLFWLALGGLLIVVTMHGTRAPVEPVVRHWAWLFRLGLAWCQ
jgi:membrane-associated phospholipid phosphatase